MHDAITDLLLALSLPQIFQLYDTTLRKHFGAHPGIATKNLPLLIERFRSWGMELPIILTHVNKVGFHVNPSLSDHEEALRNSSLNVMAMGVLASGFLGPSEAATYVRQFPSVKSVVIGASSKFHISETFSSFHAS